MFGCYSYTVIIVEGNSIEEAILKCSDLNNCFIKGYNYDPKNDIHKFHYLNDCGNKKKYPNGQPRDYKNDIETNKLFDKTYEELISLCVDYGPMKGISGELFLETNKEGWFDWIELYGNLPNGYEFSDGHDG